MSDVRVLSLLVSEVTRNKIFTPGARRLSLMSLRTELLETVDAVLEFLSAELEEDAIASWTDRHPFVHSCLTRNVFSHAMRENI